MTPEPNDLFLAAEAVAEAHGYDEAISRLQDRLAVTKHTEERTRNVILFVISKMRKRRADHEFYQDDQAASQEAEPA